MSERDVSGARDVERDVREASDTGEAGTPPGTPLVTICAPSGIVRRIGYCLLEVADTHSDLPEVKEWSDRLLDAAERAEVTVRVSLEVPLTQK